MRTRDRFLTQFTLVCAAVGMLALLGLLLTPKVLAFQGLAAATPPVDTGALDQQLVLTPYLAYFHDRTGQLTAAEVASAPYAGRFVTAGDSIPNLGLADGAVWVRLTLANSQQVTQALVLDLDLPLASQVDLYAGTPLPGAAPAFATGLTQPYATRPIQGRGFAFPLQLEPGATTTYLMRVTAGFPLRLPMTLWRPDAYRASDVQEEIWWGIVLGMLIAMSSYNLLVFLVLRDGKQLLLALFGLTVVFSSALARGYASRWLSPAVALHTQAIANLAIAAVIGAFLLLAISFLELRARLRPVYWFLTGAIGVVTLGAVIALAGYPLVAFTVFLVVLLPALAVVFAATILVLRQGLRMAVFFLIAQTIPIVFGILQSVSLLGLAPWLPSYGLAVPVNNLVLLLLMSLALADRVNVLGKEASRANAALAASKQQLADYLDALPFNVQVHDTALKPVYVNAAIRSTTQPADSALLEQDYMTSLREVPVVVAGTGEPYPLERLPILRAARGEEAHADDLVIQYAGVQVPLEAWSVPLRDAQGAVTAIITAYQDISQRRATEHELAGYREQLEERVAQRTAELAAVNVSLGVRVAQLSAINDISGSMALMTDLELTLQKAVKILCDLYAIPNASICLLDAKRGGLRVVAMEERGNGSLLAFVGQELPYNPDLEPNYLRQGPMVLSDLELLHALPAELRTALHTRQVAQVLIAPLLARDKEVGAIGLITDDPARQFTADELRVAQTIASQVAAAIDIGRLIDETRAQRDVAEALRRTTNALSRSLDQETVLATILQQLHHVLEYEGAAIALVEGDDLVIVGAEGISECYMGLRTPLTVDSAAVQVLRHGAPLMISDTQQSNAWTPWPETSPIRSWLGVPMVAGEKVIGVLNFDGTTASAFAQPQAELLMIFADQAAIAVTNARLYQQAQVAAAISERERIARDLHDAVTQSIFSASLIAEALPMQLPAAPADVQHNLALLGKLTKGALAELRALLLELRPEHLAATPLDHLVTHLAEAFTGRMGTPVQVTANCDPLYKPPPAVQLALYRIAQEALNNVAKHAQAQNVTINLVLRPGLIRLGILDDGRGFDSQMLSRARLGISIMQERAAEIGADLAIDSAPGMGTQVFLVWNEAAAADR